MPEPSFEQHLIPRATPAEAVTGSMAARLQAVPVPIDTVKRPLIVTPEFLPFDAWEFSVDIWDRKWAEAKKRAISDASLRLHMKKGTAYCLREYVRYAGGEVKSIVRPPQVVYSGPSLTREEREAWLTNLPQVRVWRIRDKAFAARGKSFYGGQQRPHFVELAYSTPSTALQRLRRRARWVVDGVETDITVSEFGSYFRLHFRTPMGKKVFSNRPVAGDRYYLPSTAKSRLVTIRPEPRLPWRSPVGPSLLPVNSEPERVRVAGTVHGNVFSGRPVGGHFLPTSAPLRVFDRYAVHDGRRVLRRPPAQFMGVGYYGWPTHTAMVDVSIPGKRPPKAAGEGHFLPRSRFWMKHDHEPVQNVRRAIVASKRLSDRILMTTGPKPRFVAGRPFIAGTDSLVVGRP